MTNRVNVSFPSPNNTTEKIFADCSLVALYVILGLGICFGNTLIIVAICRHKELRVTSNVYIVSLAVSDLLIGAAVIPLQCAELLLVAFSKDNPVELLQTIARLTAVTQRTSLATSLIYMICIAVERYVAIVHPFVYVSKFTVGRAILSSVALLLVLVFLQTIAVILAGKPSEQNHAGLSVSHAILDVIGVVTFLGLATIMYARIAIIARKHRRRIAEMAATSEENKTPRDNSKVTKLLASVLGLFYICWTPCIVMETLLQVIYKSQIIRLYTEGVPIWFSVVYLMSRMILYFNSLVNPLVYACVNKEFKNAVSKLFCK